MVSMKWLIKNIVHIFGSPVIGDSPKRCGSVNPSICGNGTTIIPILVTNRRFAKIEHRNVRNMMRIKLVDKLKRSKFLHELKVYYNDVLH